MIVLLSPAVALAQALHLSIGMPYTAVSTPTAWLVLEPFDLLAGCIALFAVDAVARRLDVTGRRRSVLAVAEVIALWDLLAQNWHPEDAFAVSFVLWALLAAFDGRWRRSGWLLGVGVAFQPLAVLALPAVVALAPRKITVGLLVRVAVPGSVLLAGPLIANPSATLRAVLEQPNHPLLDHPTPWMRFAPHLGAGVVAAGPTRLVAVIVAAVVSWMVCRRTARVPTSSCGSWRSVSPAAACSRLSWWRITSGRPWRWRCSSPRATRARFAAVCVLSSFATVFALRGWRGEWAWWSVLVVCIVAALIAAWPSPRGPGAHDGFDIRIARPADR